MTLLDVREVSVRFGGIVALDQLSFTVDEGQICGLIGPNGAGKTTMFNVISRIYDPTGGDILYDGEDLLELPAHRMSKIGIYRTFQNLALWPGMTVLENVMVGDYANTKANFLTAALRFGTRAEERDCERVPTPFWRSSTSRSTRSGRPPDCRSARSSASRSPVPSSAIPVC